MLITQDQFEILKSLEKEFKEINNPEIEARFKRAVSMVKIKPNKKETLGNYMRRIARLDTTIEGHDYWANLGICIEYSPNELNNEKYKHFLLNKLWQRALFYQAQAKEIGKHILLQHLTCLLDPTKQYE